MLSLLDLKKKSWVFTEVERVIEFLDKSGKDSVVFETGYGPSGFPHIGTFGEIVRTMMVINAVKYLRPDLKVEFIAYSDDMDGLRKIPSNIPNPDLFVQYLGLPLTTAPSPFGEGESYGGYMNNRLRDFIKQFGFQCQFKSATQCYKSGFYNDAIKKILGNYEAFKALVLPLLGEERQRNYHPIIPICKKTGKALLTDIVSYDATTGDIVYVAHDGELVSSSALNGGAKMQWRIDWGMRWYVLGVGYEMHGKDLDSSAEVALKVCELLGGLPPVLYRYEMFLDEEGKKISKSKGNGVSLEQWLRYASPESLMLYMYNNPHRAKSLALSSIPKTVDDYLRYHATYHQGDDIFSNPLWHIHNGCPPKIGSIEMNFSMMLNIAYACRPDSLDFFRRFLQGCNMGDLTDLGWTLINDMIDKVFLYYQEVSLAQDIVYKVPDAKEILGLRKLYLKLGDNVLDYQELFLSIGEDLGYNRSQMKPWFQSIYRILFGSESGPRIGSFIKLYGPDETRKLIRTRMGDLLDE